LKQLDKYFQSLSLRQLQHEAQVLEDKKERDVHLALLEEELKIVREKDEYIRKLKKYSHASSSRLSDSHAERSLRVNEYYQPPPRKTRRESPKETRVDLPHFYGKENVETYLYWDMKVKQPFAFHHVNEEMMVPLATLSFQGNAMYWWTTLKRDRRLHKDPPIEYWNDLRRALRRRHIPSYYNRELMFKLQRFQQKNMSVDEYRQKMEFSMMRASIRKEETTTISRFLSGLNLEIRDRVKLLPYRDLNDLIKLSIKVVQQILRKESSHKKSSYSNSYPKKEYKKEREDSFSKDKSKVETPKNLGKDVSTPQTLFVMLLLIMGNEQHKGSKNNFEKGPISFQQNFYKSNKGPYFLTI